MLIHDRDEGRQLSCLELADEQLGSILGLHGVLLLEDEVDGSLFLEEVIK